MVVDEEKLYAGLVYERTCEIICEKMDMAICRFARGDVSAKLDASLFISFAMNSAFACELFLKALLPPNTYGKHGLLEYFSQLHPDNQEQVKNKTVIEIRELLNNDSYDGQQFDYDLKEMNDCFNKWRYYYEEGTPQTSPQFLKAFMNALKEFACQVKNEGAVDG